MIRVVLADDHQLIREGLKKIFRDEQGIHVVHEAGTAAEIFNFLRSSQADVLVLDVNMPGRSGIDILSDLKKEFPGIAILMLSMHPEDALAVRALRAGASGYITKNAPPEEIVNAVRKIASGRKYVSESLAEQLADTVRAPAGTELHRLLSDREFEVFQLLGSGKTVTEVASLLSISVPTVSTYRARILEKLNMRSTAEIIHYAVRNKLVE
jgi:two-component system invasion response regulator UvrY